MKALGKILGLLLLGLLLLLVALGLALTHLFDPNDYKDEISQLARDKAGVELRLQGDIGWSLFPWLGLELSRCSSLEESIDKVINKYMCIFRNVIILCCP